MASLILGACSGQPATRRRTLEPHLGLLPAGSVAIHDDERARAAVARKRIERAVASL